MDPVTGFFRTGKCETNAQDVGMHTVCVEVTEEFLDFNAKLGNDLVTPMPEHEFPGLKPGDRWCVCIGAVLEAIRAGLKPRIALNATHASVLEFIPKEQLLSLSIDAPRDAD